MLDENALIRLFIAQLPADARRIHPFFEADAETLEIGGERVLFTIDGFDAEDHLRTDDAYTLGHNLAAGTVSDLFAGGGQLLYFGHGVTVSASWDAEYIRAFSRGIADVIRACGGRFAGGDMGCAAQWHYTGVAIGRARRPLTRKGAAAGDRIYISGPIGAGNFEAAAELLDDRATSTALHERHGVRFPVRHREAALLARYASACIDTSDGVLRALRILSDINACGFRVENLPYCAPARKLMSALRLPAELLLAGECGEYELLFTIPPQHEDAFLSDCAAEGRDAHAIGELLSSRDALLRGPDGTLDLSDFTLEARQFVDHREYVRALIAYFTGKLPETTSAGG
ncbi:MAG: AIR synthase related protein [Bacteroidota bacterium]|nr:AIR synthase related protein [Bacteroidota bacterium]